MPIVSNAMVYSMKEWTNRSETLLERMRERIRVHAADDGSIEIVEIVHMKWGKKSFVAATTETATHVRVVIERMMDE